MRLVSQVYVSFSPSVARPLDTNLKNERANLHGPQLGEEKISQIQKYFVMMNAPYGSISGKRKSAWSNANLS